MILFDIVKSMGQWSSDAFTLYLRKHAVIMAPYLQGSPILEAFTRYMYYASHLQPLNRYTLPAPLLVFRSLLLCLMYRGAPSLFKPI